MRAVGGEIKPKEYFNQIERDKKIELMAEISEIFIDSGYTDENIARGLTRSGLYTEDENNRTTKDLTIEELIELEIY